MKLRDRVALVTGGGSGIGRAICLLFATEGARVVVNDIDPAAAEATVKAMRGGRALSADVADSEQVKAMFGAVEQEHGGLDILVNNAGIAAGGFEDRQGLRERGEARIREMVGGQGIKTHLDATEGLDDASWRRMFAVHVDGTFYCTREALRLMRGRSRAAIVNISSVAALMGLATVPHYSAAKGAILAFTRAVAQDVASRGIRVNAICPGYIDTPMTAPASPLMKAASLSRTPLGRFGEPDEVARTALFLASDDSSFFTGQWLSPNGGLFIG
jgi:3-oxoacyl-[acyl-carrier protein] reductase